MPYDRVLHLMSPAGAPNLFVLGAFAKRLTIRSQQVRAINLIDAIQFYRYGLADARIAVVGGGIAGLTAAARALEYGGKVTVFEQNASLIGIQNSANHRWVHPNVYDWPYADDDTPAGSDAGLEVLNWAAGNADVVSAKLLESWAEIMRNHAKSVNVRTYASVTSIRRQTDIYQVNWTDRTGGVARSISDNFDIVILAVGFGLEPEGVGRDSYWKPEGLAWTGRPGSRRVLVAGYGDGALTDLMRVCLLGFDHERILEAVIAALDRGDIACIREIENDCGEDDAAELTFQYSTQVDFPAIRRLLHDRLNPLFNVVLTGAGPYLFDPRASTLNRLVVSQLLRENAFEHVPLPEGVRIGRGANTDPAIADILSRTKAPPLSDFTDFVLRFGTSQILPSDPARPLVKEQNGRRIIEGLPDSLTDLRDEWWTLSAADDPTRRPLWQSVRRLWTRSRAQSASPPRASNINRYCLTVQPMGPGQKSQWLPGAVATAIGILRQKRVLPFEPIPITLPVEDCVRDPEALASAVRALCQAPIAVFNLGEDMGQRNAAGLLLLGIRAAVRRGMTLVVHDKTEGEPNWKKLPFNLKELLVLPLTASEVDKLASVITSGWTISREGLGDYRDLPVFDVVRQFERRTPKVELGRHEVFALAPFDEQYLKTDWPRLVNMIRRLGTGTTVGRLFDIRPVTDYLSPLLVGDRIYELARFVDTCIVDWTHWRANVFFELGVRLTVNQTPPICVMKSGEETKTHADGNLIRIFAPIIYDLDDEDSPVGQKFNLAIMTATSRIEGHRARLRQIFAAAENNVSLDQEFGRLPLEQELVRQVNAAIGPDIARVGSVKTLYPDNGSLIEQTRRAVFDRLGAAHMLLDFKIGIAKAAGTDCDGLIESRAKVANRLRDLIESGFAPEYEQYRMIIDATS